MNTILFSLLFAYILPVIFIIFSIFHSEFFKYKSGIVIFSQSLSQAYISIFRDSFAAMILPLITAYSIPIRDSTSAFPKQTIRVFFVLLCMLIIVIIFYGIVVSSQTDLERYNVYDQAGKLKLDVFAIYSNTLISYTKELIAYIAIIFGITLKK